MWSLAWAPVLIIVFNHEKVPVWVKIVSCAAVCLIAFPSEDENLVVAAGAVVTKDVPANTIVGGVPARKIRDI